PDQAPDGGQETFGTAPAPQALPRVQPMPSGAPSVSVRRGILSGDPDPEPDGAAPRNRTVAGVTVGRLPTIGAPVDDAPPTQATAAPDPGDDVTVADLPAYRRYAAAAEFAPEARRLGVVLIDAPTAEAALLELPFPVTVAMDPYDPDAPRRATAYRLAGHDVVLLAAGVPPLATATDIAVTLRVWTQTFPEIVGLMDVPLNGIGSHRALAREMAGMLVPEGLAVIALRGGLDAFLQSAEEAGLARASVYRALDDGGRNAVTIRRLIDRAAFEAQRSDGIIVSGSADSAETIEMLIGFADGRGRGGVVLVPASAVLTTD
ncbi:MAG: divergent polysaccharide deacetylase family protein, partial [Rhodobacteraceae bacterium]|nr:divergent polysaccharide deacetylase family protein [Paracoccaceae bacterium]